MSQIIKVGACPYASLCRVFFTVKHEDRDEQFSTCRHLSKFDFFEHVNVVGLVKKFK